MAGSVGVRARARARGDAPRPASLLGARVRVGDDHAGSVSDVLVDGAGAPVLLLVEGLAPGAAYVPHAALEALAGADLRVSGPHLLMGRAEASFYESQGFSWLRDGDVSRPLDEGIVES